MALPQRGQRLEEDAQLVPQLEHVEQPVQPVTFEMLEEQLPPEQEEHALFPLEQLFEQPFEQ